MFSMPVFEMPEDAADKPESGRIEFDGPLRQDEVLRL